MATVTMIDKGTQTSEPPMDEQLTERCMLLELPIELRLQIYSYLWEPTPPFVHIIVRGSTMIRDTPPLNDARALMATCRRLNTDIANVIFDRQFTVTIQNHSATSTLGQFPLTHKCNMDFLRRCSTVYLDISFNGALWNLRATMLLEKLHQALVLLRTNSELQRFNINVNLTNVDMFVRDEVMGELVSTQERILRSTLRGEKELDKLAIGWRVLWKLTAVLERVESPVSQEDDDGEDDMGHVVGYDGVNWEFM